MHQKAQIWLLSVFKSKFTPTFILCGAVSFSTTRLRVLQADGLPLFVATSRVSFSTTRLRVLQARWLGTNFSWIKSFI